MLQLNQSGASFPQNPSSVCQVEKTATSLDVNLPTSVAAGDTVESELILSCGYKVFGIGIIADQSGELSVQRYLSRDTTIPQDGGTPFTAAITANDPVSLNVTDDKPFQSFKISVENTSLSVMTITHFILLMQAN